MAGAAADTTELFSAESLPFKAFLDEIKKGDSPKIHDPFKRKQIENSVYATITLPLTTGPPTRSKNTGHHKAKEAMSAALVDAKIDPVLFFSTTHRGSCVLDGSAAKKALSNKNAADKKWKHWLDDDLEGEKTVDAKEDGLPTSDKTDAMADSASEAEDEGDEEEDEKETKGKVKSKGKKKAAKGRGKKRKAPASKGGRQSKKAASGQKKAKGTIEQENRELRKTNDKLTRQLKIFLGKQIDEGKAKLEKQMAEDGQKAKGEEAPGPAAGSASPASADPLSSLSTSPVEDKEKHTEDKEAEKEKAPQAPNKKKHQEQCTTCRNWSDDFIRCQSKLHKKEKPVFYCGSPECGGYCSAESCGKAICENCAIQCRGPRLALGVDGVASTGDCVASEDASGLFCMDDECIDTSKSRCHACTSAEDKLEKEEKSDDEGRGSAAGDGNTNDDDEETAKADAEDKEAAEEEEEAAKNADKKDDSDEGDY